MKSNIPTKKLNNGMEMPMVGLGVWEATGGGCAGAVETALAAGYRLIDTASFYKNEKEVGEGIRRSGVPREAVFLTTKLWNADQLNNNQLPAFEASLAALGVDYVDLYLIHWPVPGKFTESWKVLEAIQKSGRAKAIGVSNFNKHHLDTLMETATITPVVNQIELHPLFAQQALVDDCAAMGIAAEAWRPLGGRKGGLTDNPTLAAIGQGHGKTAAQVMLRWQVQRGVIVIPKSVTPARIAANLELFDFELTADEMATIVAMDQNHRFGEDPDNIMNEPKLMEH